MLKITDIWIVLIFVFVIFLESIFAATIIDRKFEIESDKKDTLSIPDTLVVTIAFEDQVPPDFLYGYTRFGIKITDSVPEITNNCTPLLHIELDAGFLYFTHDLCISFKYGSGLLSEYTSPYDLRLFQDNYPVTRFHLWNNCDSIVLDTNVKTIGLVYHHIKYSPDQLQKRSIATSGYPVNFCLVKYAASSIHNRNVKVNRPGHNIAKASVTLKQKTLSLNHSFMSGYLLNGNHTNSLPASNFLIQDKLID